MKDTDGYEEVLWAVVDHSDLIRPIDAIYESYLQLMDFLEDEPLDRATFVNRLNSLKTAGFGKILVSDRRGWYKFRENITRGYVRLRAEDQGIQLALDVSPGPVTSTSRQRGARKSRRGTTVAQWRSTRNPTGF
ncbi:MAG TPA: hypothetical protein VM578_09375 [Candidatus Saccharimonadales bacterium]|nr:hypothetical protein [Candidatus Saccharimonadales bacterium]